MNLVLIWFFMIIVALIEFPKMKKEGQIRTMIVFVPLWLLAGIYASLVYLEAPIPNPTDILMWIIPAILDGFINFLIKYIICLTL